MNPFDVEQVRDGLRDQDDFNERVSDYFNYALQLSYLEAAILLKQLEMTQEDESYVRQ